MEFTKNILIPVMVLPGLRHCPSNRPRLLDRVKPYLEVSQGRNQFTDSFAQLTIADKWKPWQGEKLGRISLRIDSALRKVSCRATLRKVSKANNSASVAEGEHVDQEWEEK